MSIRLRAQAVESFIGGAMMVAIVVLVITVASAENSRRHRRRQRLDDLQTARPPLPAADFATLCGVPRNIVDRVRRVLAAVSEEAYANPRQPVDPNRLHPDDELCQELGYDLDSLSFVELLIWLEAEFGFQVRLEELLPKQPSQLTVGDIARAVAAQMEAP